VGPTQPAIECVVGNIHSPGSKVADCEGDHSPPSSARVKNEWRYVSIHPYAFVLGTGITLYFIELVRGRENKVCIFNVNIAHPTCTSNLHIPLAHPTWCVNHKCVFNSPISPTSYITYFKKNYVIQSIHKRMVRFPY
jgi:hypothetical protein